MRRLMQVERFARKQSKLLSKECNLSRLKIYTDMLFCFLKYKMWTNQYVKENFHLLSSSERERIGKEYIKTGRIRDAWQKDFRKNRKFFIKYGNIKYEKVSLREKRNKAYAKRYNAEENFVVEYDVHISRQHYLDGTIKIGKDVLFSKHVTIDYSGDVIIGDKVKLSDGVVIESHTHPGYTNPSMTGQAPRKESLTIEDGCVIGTKTIILESCHKIGRHSRIGAGTVVRFDIPPYAVVTGNPGKIVGFTFNPEEMADFEKSMYSIEQRTSREEYEKIYKKYFSSKLREIKSYIKRSI